MLVAGATGTLGRLTTRALRCRGHRVRALTRRSVSAQQLEADEIAKASATAGTGLAAALRGVGTVVSCLGASVAPTPFAGYRGYWAVDTRANMQLLRAAEEAGVERFVYVSVARHKDLVDLDYVAAHEAVVDALSQSRLHSTVLRPTGFFAAFAALLSFARFGFVPLLGDPAARTNPISEEDLAELCAAAVDEAPEEIEAGGPDVLSRRTIAELAGEAVGRRVRIVRAPAWGVALARRLVWPLSPRLSQILPFYQRVSEQDCLAEPRGKARLRDYFGRLAPGA